MLTTIFEQIMGPELGKIFTALTNELSALSAIYDDCIYLFADNSTQRVVLLNSTANAFFWRVQKNFENELMLGICRITDPAATTIGGQKKENLTVRRLEYLVRQQKPSMDGELKANVLSANSASTFARDWRNRWLAHRSLDVAVSDPMAKPLDSATYVEIDKALTALDKVLVSVGIAFNGNGVGFNTDGYRNLSGSKFGGSSSLVRILEIGLRESKSAASWFKSGNPTEENIA